MTSYRTAGTDHAAVAAVVVVVECTFAVVFSAVVAEPAVVVVSAGVAAGPTFVVVSTAAVEPTSAGLSVVVVVVAVDRSAVDISAAAVAGGAGWSMAEAAAGCSWSVLTCCEVGGQSCCSQSWEDPVMLLCEVAGRRSVQTDIVVVVVVVVMGQLEVAAEAAEVSQSRSQVSVPPEAPAS